jgi:hypothetical protein
MEGKIRQLYDAVATRICPLPDECPIKRQGAWRRREDGTDRIGYVLGSGGVARGHRPLHIAGYPGGFFSSDSCVGLGICQRMRKVFPHSQRKTKTSRSGA